MTIEGVNVGARVLPATIKPEYWTSTGISMAGVPTRVDFGITKNDVAVSLQVTATTLASLRSALNAIRRGGLATVVPDSGDDLGIGISASTELLFMDFSAEFIGGEYWSVYVLFHYYT